MRVTDSSWQWWTAEQGAKHTRVFAYVENVESEQATIYERFARLEYLYDPNSLDARRDYFRAWDQRGVVSENVIASNVDTVTAVIAATEVRVRMMTDDADWSTQRRAVHLEWYAEQLSKTLNIHPLATDGFRDATIKGTGLLKVYASAWNEIRVERVHVDDIIVDENEVRTGKPRQMHQRALIHRDVLLHLFPQKRDAIMAATATVTGQGRRIWAGYRPIPHDEVVVLESWRLPHGKTSEGWAIPGCHTLCIRGMDLVDEEWKKPHFPFAVFHWSKRTTGWYGVGLAERIAGHQRTLNKNNWQIDALLDQMARPTTYVRMSDANLMVRTTNRIGSIVPYKTEVPKTVIPPAVSPEVYARREAIKASAFEESGVSRMAAQSYKPGGLDSGAALREYRDQTTQRFAIQEKEFERFYLRTVWLVLDVAKDLGAKAPTMVRSRKYGAKKIEWGAVDMGEVKVQIAAASQLSRTPAGRTQMVLEWAQAGVVSMEEAQRLLVHPDTRAAMSLYTAALEDIDRCIEEILDGALLVPEPLQNLKMGIWRMQQAYLRAKSDGAPEEILEGLRQWITQASFILNPPTPEPTAMAAPEPEIPIDEAPPMAEQAVPLPPAGAAPQPTPPMVM
jgi:hypothetical protein